MPDDVEQLKALLEIYKPKLVINLAVPYQGPHIMEACLAWRRLHLPRHGQLRAQRRGTLRNTAGSGLYKDRFEKAD
jgi:hypothetical protein